MQFLAEDVAQKSIFLDLNAPDTLRRRIEREKAFEKTRKSLTCPTHNITKEEAMALVDEETKAEIDGYLKGAFFQSFVKANSKVNRSRNLSSSHDNSENYTQAKHSEDGVRKKKLPLAFEAC